MPSRMPASETTPTTPCFTSSVAAGGALVTAGAGTAGTGVGGGGAGFGAPPPAAGPLQAISVLRATSGQADRAQRDQRVVIIRQKLRAGIAPRCARSREDTTRR